MERIEKLIANVCEHDKLEKKLRNKFIKEITDEYLQQLSWECGHEARGVRKHYRNKTRKIAVKLREIISKEVEKRLESK
tara:strand:- start:11 stop:247 length:237 start_codon:yes stop_codon:yes gene_type:complete